MPNANVPPLKNVTRLVMIPPEPMLAKLFTVAGTNKVTALTAPVKVAVPVIFAKDKMPTSLTLVPLTFVALVKVKSNPPPVTAPKSIVPAPEVAKIVVLPKVISPRLIAAFVVTNVPFKVTSPPTALVSNPLV